MTGTASYQWIPALASRYQRAVADTEHANPALLEHLHALILASAALDKLHINATHSSHRTHIAVLGPTQSGKSTLVNILLDNNIANVSPLAGFTVHSQGYGHDISPTDADLVENLMAPLKKTAAAELNSNQLDSYVLETVPTGPNATAGDALVWDTPDFDSISANDYSLAVLKTAAIADVAILMVSKDKYGDKRVWDMLALLNGIGKSLMVCINKVDGADRAVIENAFNSRYHEFFQRPAPALILLPFIRNTQTQNTLPLDNPTRQALQHALQSARDSIDRESMPLHFSTYVSQHEEHWLQPLVNQLEAQEQWHTLILTAIDEADEYYNLNYLNSPEKYDTFNRALAELLTLLEIPGVATKLVQARQIITWPARRLLGVGKQALGNLKETSTGAQGQLLDQEALVLERMLENVLNSLQRQLLEAPASPWWRGLDKQLRDTLPPLRQRYLEASELSRKSFEIEIDRAAKQLYQQLEKKPALLNSLRAARVSADAAAVALAVKSGGLAPADLVLAPAMLSVTTLLTENALGRYLDSIKRDLKRRQRQHMKKEVLEEVLQTRLMQLGDELGLPESIAGNLEPELNDHLQKYRPTKQQLTD